MISKELERKMDELCSERKDTCRGCPCENFDVCTKPERLLTDEDYIKGIEALESHECVEADKSTTDDTKVSLHATEEPVQWPDEDDGETEEFFADFDVVNRPAHYTKTSIECIDAMRETQGDEAVKAFCVCNAFKYLWRHNAKNGDEDIKKASWYLNKAVEIMER